VANLTIVHQSVWSADVKSESEIGKTSYGVVWRPIYLPLSAIEIADLTVAAEVYRGLQSDVNLICDRRG